jgi:hypothetical protein
MHWQPRYGLGRKGSNRKSILRTFEIIYVGGDQNLNYDGNMEIKRKGHGPKWL